MDERVNLLPLYAQLHRSHSFLFRYFSILYRGRKIVKKIHPDIVIGVMPVFFVLAKLVTLGLKIPVIASDHTSFSKNSVMRFRFIRFHLYPFADAVTILTHLDYSLLGNKLPRKVVMPNPLSYPVFSKKSIRRKNILAVGRLDVWKIKGFDMLIEAWEQLACKFPDWILEIAGTGSEKSYEELKSMVTVHGLENRINFLGFRTDIDSIMREASIFILSSRIEGFPMGLVEAMSQGCACVSFAIGGAVSEIITHDRNGIIVDDGDISSLAQELSVLMTDKDKRERLSKNAVQDISRFEADNIAQKWEELFSRLK